MTINMERVSLAHNLLEAETELYAEIASLKAALKKFGFTQIGPKSSGNMQCNSCGWFGMRSHNVDCEIGPLL